jgi:hypothetical protein
VIWIELKESLALFQNEKGQRKRRKEIQENDTCPRFFFARAKQVLYRLSHTSSPFCSGYFGDGGLSNYLPRVASNHNSPDLGLPSS